MSVVLHPRIATGDRLQVWIGVLGRRVPCLQWKLDGQSCVPSSLKPIQSVRSQAMLQGHELHAFTGVYEFQGPCIRPGTAHWVEVSVRSDGGIQRNAKILVRTLPSEVPEGMSKSFNVLLVSCFHHAKDRSGVAGYVVAELSKREQFRPDMTLLLGDQVYLDLPAIGKFNTNLPTLAKMFEAQYSLNWSCPTGYARILRAAPSVSIPDDHEYWTQIIHGTC